MMITRIAHSDSEFYDSQPDPVVSTEDLEQFFPTDHEAPLLDPQVEELDQPAIPVPSMDKDMADLDSETLLDMDDDYVLDDVPKPPGAVAESKEVGEDQDGKEGNLLDEEEGEIMKTAAEDKILEPEGILQPDSESDEKDDTSSTQNEDPQSGRRDMVVVTAGVEEKVEPEVAGSSEKEEEEVDVEMETIEQVQESTEEEDIEQGILIDTKKEEGGEIVALRNKLEEALKREATLKEEMKQLLEPASQGECIMPSVHEKALQELDILEAKLRQHEQTDSRLEECQTSLKSTQGSCPLPQDSTGMDTGSDTTNLKAFLPKVNLLVERFSECQKVLAGTVESQVQVQKHLDEQQKQNKALSAIKSNLFGISDKLNALKSSFASSLPGGVSDSKEDTAHYGQVSLARVLTVISETEEIVRELQDLQSQPNKEVRVLKKAQWGIEQLESQVSILLTQLEQMNKQSESEEPVVVKTIRRAAYVLGLVVGDLVIFQMLLPKGSRCLILIVVVLWAWVSYLALLSESRLVCSLCLCNCALAACYICNPYKEEKFLSMSF